MNFSSKIGMSEKEFLLLYDSSKNIHMSNNEMFLVLYIDKRYISKEE